MGVDPLRMKRIPILCLWVMYRKNGWYYANIKTSKTLEFSMFGRYIIPYEKENNLQDGHDTHSFNLRILNPLELICSCH
jgi:hypothetical protein